MWNFVGCYQTWAERTERVESLPTILLPASFLQLPVSSADIVGARVAEYIIQSVLAGDVLALRPDDDRQLAFVIDFVTSQMRGNKDGSPGCCSVLSPLMKRTGYSGTFTEASSAWRR